MRIHWHGEAVALRYGRLRNPAFVCRGEREFRGIDSSESAGSTNLFLKFGGGVRCYVANKRESVPN